MSSVNARVPPSRIAAIDSPADGEVAAYQASSGQFEWVANGSGGGGSVTSVALTETGSALTITGSPITGAGTFNIAGAGSSSQVILGDLSLGTLTSGTVTSVALTETGSALTITGSPITGSGTLNIAGAGTSSQVILGDLSLGTLTSGTVTSVALTESGNALTVTGSPITGSGTLNISGAGSSSQVILGDLTLATLPTGTVTGTGSANQVSYWTAASVQAGSTGLTYDPSTGNLTVGGYVETGTKVITPSGTNLELTTGSASSGSIVIADGVDGQISITPNGAGTIKLDGVQLDNSAIATGYVLKATSATAAGWAAESGGGGITFPIEADSGSSSAPSYAFSADTDTGIYLSGASNMGIAAGGQNYLFIGSLGSVQFNKKALFNAATAAAPNGFATDTNTGFFQPSADTIGFSTAGTERLRFGSSGEILVGGTASGASGQVLTSGGSGAAVSWTTPSGGSSIWNQTNTKNNINSSYRRFVVSRLAPWGQYGTGTTTTGVVNSPHCRPFIAPVSGDVTEIGINVTTADASATTKLSIGIYSDSNGAPDSLLTLAVMNSTSTGSSFQTSFTGTATLVAGTQYWYMWVRNNTTNTINFTAMSNSHLVWIGASSTVSAGMNQQAILSLSGSNNTLPASVTQSNLTPSFYGSIELGLKIA